MIMMSDERSEESDAMKGLRRSVREMRVQIERMEGERVRFIDHITDLRVRHQREIDALCLQIRDLHQLVARLEVRS
jgi:hypothetical protein